MNFHTKYKTDLTKIIFGHFDYFLSFWLFLVILMNLVIQMIFDLLGHFGHYFCAFVDWFQSLFFQVTHPADVVKTRMQLEPNLYPSVTKACKQIVLMNGPRGFLIGLAPRMLRRTLMSAMAWTVYEEIMRQLGLKWLFFFAFSL